MRTKKIILILACVMLAFFSLGAADVLRMANTAMGEENLRDRLIGVLITREHLDLFDFDSYVRDNGQKLVNGGEITQADSAEYEGKLYAVLRDGRYVFEGVEGFGFFAAEYTGEEGSYTGSSGDEAVTSGGIHISSTDEGEGVELSGTLYVVPSANISFYFNQVYQEAGGRVYAQSGNGMSMGGESGAGMSMTHTLSDSFTETNKGVSTGWSADISLSVTVMDPPERAVLLHMGADGELLSRDEYAPDALPQSLTPAAGTQYIIAETFARGPEGEETVTREIFTPEDDYLTVFTARPDGICVEKSANINW